MIRPAHQLRPCALAILTLTTSISLAVAGCGTPSRPPEEAADLVVVNANVYTLSWPEPDADGQPAPAAPRVDGRWRGDAQAVATRGDRIVFVGSSEDALNLRGEATRVVDAQGATVVPGLIDSHVHIVELGRRVKRVDLTDVGDEGEAIRRVAAAAQKAPKGEWVLGGGWDEGAWANRYPDMARLSEAVPDHPVYLRGLHGFAVWGNRMAFERAGITAATEAPPGGEIRKDAGGAPSGILLNRATGLLDKALPPTTLASLKADIGDGLRTMAASGFVGVHEAGVSSDVLEAFEALNRDKQLPLRVYVLLSARDAALSRAWLAKGPDRTAVGMLTTRSVKAYYDGALGSRGARLLEDYSDMAGHRGVSGGDYGFDQTLVADMMKRGFQVAIHAIGDAGNRETLDFIASVEQADPAVTGGRHRIEHAQVLHPDDIPRFARLGVVASMEPPHAVEDKAWAEDRLGAERVRHAYAWRSLRRAGAALALNSDLPGSDHDIFYGLHAAITRRGKDKQPPAGWYPEENLTPEEALRGYTTWAAYAAFEENETAQLAVGRRADLTIMDIDPLAVGESDPGRLLTGKILWTIVSGAIVHPVSRP
jgi:predicted amidohydrolase YtcJ